ncbi:hypothetical protein QEJ31_00320 [Pigmentibacter sp. JX0631]|uniref:hypothetical protein n=1 Tax=Pigmentibacter sp. JX0631 TaxID=2976982 RepID=UPI002468C490|nr:hypothetical protein [Pigmentibacter sp. JX0631]WGL60047.1 hypothetical protein QEJ31_00320 [Pigmentibacter sp. JX0631]
MRNYKLCSYLFFTSIVLYSCGKEKIEKNIDAESNSKLRNYDSSKTISEGENSNIGNGYNRMGKFYTQKCIENFKVEFPKNTQETVINLMDNLTKEQLTSNLNLKLNSTIPTKEVTVTPELQYIQEASTSRLSKTMTYYSYTKLGEIKVKENEGGYTFKKDVLKFFNSDGKIGKNYEFNRLCGDEVALSQVYSSKLMITVKIKFKNKFAHSEFDGKIGVVQNAVMDDNKFKLSANINKIDNHALQNSILSIHGIQMGGESIQLNKILGLQKSSCTLDQFSECDLLLDKINKYISEDYVKEIQNVDLSRWVVESINTVKYDNLIIKDSNGNNLNFSTNDSSEEKYKLSQLKLQVENLVTKETKNIAIAKLLLGNKGLAFDVVENLNEIIDSAYKNINVYQNFANECYKNLSDCIEKGITSIEKKYITKYDEKLLKQYMGKKIMEINSQKKPMYGEKHRSSVNFPVSNFISDGLDFTNIYFKIKNYDNTSLDQNTGVFSLMCDKYSDKINGPSNKDLFTSEFWTSEFSYQYWHDLVFLNNIKNNYIINLDVLLTNYKDKCLERESAYISLPEGFSRDFIVEIWGDN